MYFYYGLYVLPTAPIHLIFSYQPSLFVIANGTIYQPLRSGRIWHKVNF